MTQTIRPARIGALFHRGPESTYASLRESLERLGRVEGRDIVFEPRFAQGQLDRLPELAGELAESGADIIVAVGAVGARALQRATATTPIVFTIVLDPVVTGLVASVERPGGNVTGVTNFDPGQARAQFELLKAVLPSLRRVAILSDHDAPKGSDGWNTLEKYNDTAAREAGLEPLWVRMRGPAPDLADALGAARRDRAEALLVLEVPVTLSRFREIAGSAIVQGLPTLLPAGDADNGLVSYGTSLLETVPDLAALVDRILNGEHPATIAVETVSRPKLVVNLQTARLLGVSIPVELRNRADRIVE